jgi:hypothetical protein
MRVPGSARPVWLACRIDVENDSSYLAPVRPFLLRIEQTQIRHEVLFVVTREDVGFGSGVGKGWVKWWCLHAPVPTKSTTFPLSYECPCSSRDA